MVSEREEQLESERASKTKVGFDWWNKTQSPKWKEPLIHIMFLLYFGFICVLKKARFTSVIKRIAVC